MPRDDVPVEVLRELLRLDADTGRLFWLPRPREMFATQRAFATWNARYAGQEAFTSDDGRGYRVGAIFNRNYRSHRVIFALHHGRWPEGDVDHRDTDPSKNLPENLREATRQQNLQNSNGKAGTSRFRGVSWYPASRKWTARCTDGDGKPRYLGRFADEEEAARAYDRAAREWHGEFTRLNLPQRMPRELQRPFRLRS